MGTFAIFALILTTVYVIYYGVVITKDILASRKTAEDSDASETLDTSFMENETTVVTDLEPSSEVQQPTFTSEDPQPDNNEEAMATFAEIVDQSLVDVDTDYSEKLTDDEYYDGLVNNGICARNIMIESHTIHSDGTTEENSVDVPLDEI